MEDEIKVSIICTVYNHEQFLRKCLDGFVMQKTNFKFEALVHDDASTDNSKKIIEEYAKKYPDIIKPFYEKENQHQKKVNITNTILLPTSNAKYIAFCEGDDYWIDENKLQKQYDYMETHKECSMCVHNTIIHNLLGKEKDKLFNNWNKIHKLTEEDVFFGWNVHTTSYFSRKEISITPNFAWHYWFGDYVRLTVAYNYGEVVFLPDIMSVYNFNNTQGITRIVNNMDIEKRTKKIEDRKEYLIEYNKFTGYKYKDTVEKKINEIEIEIMLIKYNHVKKYEEYRKIRKNVYSNKYFKEYYKKKSILGKIKFILKYRNYITFKIINKIKN